MVVACVPLAPCRNIRIQGAAESIYSGIGGDIRADGLGSRLQLSNIELFR